jgi:hypothetical protein
MLKLKKKQPPSIWKVKSGHAAGKTINDFFILGYSEDYDDYFSRREPMVEHYTHIFHFKDLENDTTFRTPYIVNSLWWNPNGMVCGFGDTQGMVEISSEGCTECAFSDLTGQTMCIWGIDDNHVFGTTIFDTSVLYRKFGSWHSVPLPERIASLSPENTPILIGIGGFSPTDVYFAGTWGTVLHFDGEFLRELEIPTSEKLWRVATLVDNQRLCIGGNNGTLLFGNTAGWRTVPVVGNMPVEVVSYKGGICFNSTDGIYFFDGTNEPGLLIDLHGTVLSVVDNYLFFSDEEGNARYFDGEQVRTLSLVI